MADVGPGFRKRVLHIDTDTISEELVGAAVDRSTLDDPALRRAISRLHETFGHGPDDLEQVTLLSLITGRITDALSGCAAPFRHSSAAAGALRSVLDEHPNRRRR